MKRISIICIVMAMVIFNQFNFAQGTTTDVKSFFPDEGTLKGYKLSGEIKEYAGRKLFDLINGGGEVYMEYGYKTVYSARYIKGEAGITIQFYVMENPVSAYGIYTYHRHPDDTIEEFTGIKEMNVQPNGVNFYYNNYFIKIESFDEGPQVIAFVKELAKSMISKISANQNVNSIIAVVPILPGKGLKKKTVKLLSGNISSSAGDNIFQGNPLHFDKQKFAYFGKYELQSGASTINFTITSIRKSEWQKGNVLYLIAKKLFGSKEAALSKSFYVTGLPVLGFTKENVRHFVYETDKSFFIFSSVKNENFKNILDYIAKNKEQFNK